MLSLGLAVLLAAMATPVVAQDLAPNLMAQIQAIMQEKANRTPIEAKLDLRLFYAIRAATNSPQAVAQPQSPSIQYLIAENVAVDGTVAVTVKATVSDDLLDAIRNVGATDVVAYPRLDAVTGRMRIGTLLDIAQREDVHSIYPTRESVTHHEILTAEQLRQRLERFPHLRVKAGSVSSEGVVAHGADLAQATGIDGTGVKVCVLSDGVDSLAARQLTKDLPDDVDVLPGQAGSGDEGTALLEIIHDMAPGAALGFATGVPSQLVLEQNIIALRNATPPCDIIVDDVIASLDSVYQDGRVARAINAVVANGALYFSAAGNSGNLTQGTSGHWEGDFAASSLPKPGLGNDPGEFHDFGGQNYVVLDRRNPAKPPTTVELAWSDPLDAKTDDYFIMITNPDGTAFTAVGGSGNKDPLAFVDCRPDPKYCPVNARVYVYRQPGGSGSGRAIWLSASKGARFIDDPRSANPIGTLGGTGGHGAAASAITVGAVDAATAMGGMFVGGEPVYWTSSDGGRQMFYNPDGTPIGGGITFASGGGTKLRKVDLVAATCVTTAFPPNDPTDPNNHNFNPICGTSAAAPHAAAIAALALSAFPAAKASDVKAALLASALDIPPNGPDRDSGVGIVMAPASVRAMLTSLAVTKNFVPASISRGGKSTLTIALTNHNSVLLKGIKFTDFYPAGISNSTPPNAGVVGPAGCELATMTALAADIALDVSSAAVPAFSTCTFTVEVTGATRGTYTDPSGDVTTPVDLNTSAASATLEIVEPDLTIAKTHVGNFNRGQVGAIYSIAVTNAGLDSTLGTVTVTDTLPPSLTATGIAGGGWSCDIGTLSCARSDVLDVAASYPTINLTVDVAKGAPASVVNIATVFGGGETNTSNDTGNDATTINAPDLMVAMTHSPPGNFDRGQVGVTYSIMISNTGAGPTADIVSITDNLPGGLNATGIAGGGWSCTLATLTCTRSDALDPGTSYPAITLTVNVANNAPSSVVNGVTVSGGAERDTSNDSASDTSKVKTPNLIIAKTHIGSFTQGDVGATYAITVTNIGVDATTGAVSVADSLPVGLSATGITGAGWSCDIGTLSCTRSDALPAGGSYASIVVVVSVAINAPPSVTNVATVSGGGEAPADTGNNAAADATMINPKATAPDLIIAKTHSGSFTQTQVGAAYSITVTNIGNAPTTGQVVTVTDALPTELTATAIAGAGWSCAPLPTLSCSRSDQLAAGAGYPTITLTVSVSATAPPSVTNTATVAGGGEAVSETGNNTTTDPTLILPFTPDLIIAKTHLGNFRQGQVGAIYSITVTNIGSAPTTGPVTVTDTLPTGLTATAIAGAGWSCAPLPTLACSRSDPLAAGGSYPKIVLTVIVPATDALHTAPPSVINSATVAGGGEIAANTGNNTATDPTVINATPLVIGAVSRKVHGTAGTFDLPLFVTVDPTFLQIEPRRGPSHTIVFTYDKPITSASVSVLGGTATVGSPVIAGATVTVPLTGVKNAQFVLVSVDTVVATDGTMGGGDVMRIGFLAGDVNGDGVVTLADALLFNTMMVLTTPVTAAMGNFLFDVNVNGVVTLGDLGITNAAIGTSLPPP